MKRLRVTHLPPQRGCRALAPSGYSHPIPPFSLGSFLLRASSDCSIYDKLFQRENLIQFSMHFPSHIREFLLLPFMNYCFTLSLLFLSRNVHFLFRRGSDLHTWKWLLVRWDVNKSPLLGHDLLHGFRDF